MPPPTPVAVYTYGYDYRSGVAPQPTITIYALDGKRLASTTLAPVDQGSGEAAVAPDGVMFHTRGHLYELKLNGSVVDLGVPPASLKQRFAVSPDGRSVAYGARVIIQDNPPTWHNQLWVWPIGGTPRLLADRVVSDSIHPADAPDYWWYDVEKWVPGGILIGRLPYGIGGYGPYLGEGYWYHAALVDPASGRATALTNDFSCPLSGLDWDGTWTCFRHDSSYPARAVGIVVHHPDGSVQTWSMSGANLAGEAHWESLPNRLAYSTVTADPQPQWWEPATVMRVLDAATGQARVLGSQGLHPMAWLRDGTLLGARFASSPASQGAQTYALVIADPSSGAVRTVTQLDAFPAGVIIQP